MRPILYILLTTSVFAQRSVPPAVFRAPEKVQQSAPSQHLTLRAAPERWLPPVTAVERASKQVRPGLTQIGFHRAVTPADVEGSWQTSRDGSSIWRLILRSPGAAAMRLHLEEFHAAGGQLWITELHENQPQSFGPYSNDGVHGDGEFWTSVAIGEAVLIEYQTTSRSRSLPFRIAEISHLTGLPVLLAKPSPDMTLAKTGDSRAAALSCNIDVNCRPEYAELARAVARISFETGDGGALCSGTVINTRNSSFVPYFMTAAHCISTDAEARTVEAFFLYQSQSCDGPAPTAGSVRRALGARYVTGSSLEGGDFTLLRLNSVPDGTIFAGWTADELGGGSAVTGIHHPTGDLKKISFGSRGDYVNTRSRPAQNFYTINWREGVTQGGSSGSGIFNDQNQLVGMLSGGPRPATGQTECDLRPAFDWYGRFDVAFPQIRTFLEDRAGSTPGSGGTTDPAGGAVLTSGTPLSITLAPVASSTLFSGNQGYRVQVPEGATELEINLVTATGNADLDLFVSFESEPAIESGRIRSDYSAITGSGNERILINAQSSPPLRPGTYYIALASFTTGQEIAATLTARIGAGGTGGGASQTTLLSNGVSRDFSLPAVQNGVVFLGRSAYRIDVPAGATQLQIRVNTATANADVDLYARFDGEVGVENGRVSADYRSTSDSGNETITIDAQSTPPLRAGTYFMALGLFTRGVEVTGSITASVSTAATGGNAQPVVLASGASRPVSLPTAAGPTLFSGDLAFQITVPEGATRLKIDLRGATPDVDVDMFVKFGALARVSGGKPDADFASEGPAGDESIDINTGSTPALKPGVYYIQFVNFTNEKAFAGTIAATVERTAAAPTAPIILTSGVPGKLALPAVEGPILYSGNYGYRIEVPEGATRLTVRLSTATPDADVDLYVRHGADVDLTPDGEIVADSYSETLTGNEVIVLTAGSNPPLRAGTYYIATALFTPGLSVTGSVTATIERAPSATPTLGRELTFSDAATFSLPAVDGPVLFGGSNVFRVNVNQPGGLRFELRTATPGVDVDIHVRFQQPPAVENGSIAADFTAAGGTGNEDLTVLPNLIGNRLGTYYVALSVYTPGTPITGTLLVTPIVPGASGDEKRELQSVSKEFTGAFVKPKVRLTAE
jgi:hypothetical protein